MHEARAPIAARGRADRVGDTRGGELLHDRLEFLRSAVTGEVGGEVVEARPVDERLGAARTAASEIVLGDEETRFEKDLEVVVDARRARIERLRDGARIDARTRAHGFEKPEAQRRAQGSPGVVVGNGAITRDGRGHRRGRDRGPWSTRSAAPGRNPSVVAARTWRRLRLPVVRHVRNPWNEASKRFPIS